MLHIVANLNTVNKFKKSKYFRNNLGLVATVEKNGRRAYNDKDKFCKFYNTLYKTIIYAQGNIGNIKIYTDHYISGSSFGVYYGENFEEFIFEFNDEIVKKNGLDFYMGSILKNIEEKYEEKVKNDELRKIKEEKKGNPDVIIKNPGYVTYEDLKAYLSNKQNKRYSL